jgi:hypothetical protein
MTELKKPSTGAARPAPDWLGLLLDKRIDLRMRAKGLRQLSAAVMARASSPSEIVDSGATMLAGAVDRMPIRNREALYAEYGSDDEVVATQVIEDAARLAGWLWTAAAAIPGPPMLVHTIKVVAHSAIELRLIGELYVIYGDDSRNRDTSWLGAVMTAWAVGKPVGAGAPDITSVHDIAVRTRQAYCELVARDSRLAGVANRGREGADTIRQTGRRYQRRMRLHPTTWERSGDGSVAGVLTDVVISAVAARTPLPKRDSRPSLDPVEHLDEAWRQHRQAQRRAGVSRAGCDKAVLDRLHSALVLQENHLRDLSTRLGRQAPAISAIQPHAGGDLASAHEHAWRAEAAIDRVEDAGARPRRLGSWPVRVRNAVVYLLTAVVVSTPLATATATVAVSATWAVVALSLTQVTVLPMLTLAIGSVAVGRLFRPWLGGRAPRSPVAGLLVAFMAHAVVASAVAVFALT